MPVAQTCKNNNKKISCTRKDW